MSEALQALLDFVEGRMKPADFEQRIFTDPALERLLQDESLTWHDTYITTNPYYFLTGLIYNDPGDVLSAQGAVELFLNRKEVPYSRTKVYSDLYGVLLMRNQNGSTWTRST